MNKEQIKKFWEDHKEEIIGGTLVLVSIAIIGVSVGSAVKANKIEHQKAIESKRVYENFCKEMVNLGAKMTVNNPYPVATKEVAEKVLEQGEVYLLNGSDVGMKIIYVFDKEVVEKSGLKNYL